MSRRIFIYEPHATGHHVGFLRILVAAFRADRTWEITISTSEDALRHPAFKGFAEKFGTEVELAVEGTRDPSLAGRMLGSFYGQQFDNFMSLRRQFAALHRRTPFDFALVPYLEAVGLHNLALWPCFGQVPWAVIPHGLRFHFRESGIKAPARRIDWLQRLCFARILRMPAFAAMFTLDPYLARWANHSKVAYVPDPAPLPPKLDSLACRRKLGLPAKPVVVLAYGAVDGRKCVDLLLPALAEVDPACNVLLVVAGRQDARVRALMAEETATRLKRDGRLIEFNRFVSAEEEEMLFTASDIVWIYNRNTFGSSGVLIRAGQYSRPVIVGEFGMARKLVVDEQCGVAVESPAPAVIAQAIVALAGSPALRREMGERGYALFSKHTPDAFATLIRAAIDRALHVAPHFPRHMIAA